MGDYVDLRDKVDALDWLIEIARENEPVGGYSQLDRNRLHVAKILRDEAERESRR